MTYSVTIDENTITLNDNLIEKQEVTVEEIGNILGLHARKMILYSMLECTENEWTDNEIEDTVSDLTKLEFALQRAWGFPQSMAYHRFWQTPRCKCPTMDNEERYGTKQFIIMASCPLHGDNTGFRSTLESQ